MRASKAEAGSRTARLLVAWNAMAPLTERRAHKGLLGDVTFARLLVDLYSTQSSGVLFLEEGSSHLHVVRFERGIPTKTRPGDPFALLGQLLVERGALDATTLEQALATGGLLGDVLLLTDRVDRHLLETTVEFQFLTRMTRWMALPDPTSFEFVLDDTTLVDWGGEPNKLHPLFVLWYATRKLTFESENMQKELERFGEAELKIHDEADLEPFGFDESEKAVLASLEAHPTSFEELCSSTIVTKETARKLVYVLELTRCLQRHGSGQPVSARTRERGGAVSRENSRLARMQLQSTVYRLGAAAPDAPGDGTRGAVVPRTRRTIESGAHRPVQVQTPSVPPTLRASTSQADAREGAKLDFKQARDRLRDGDIEAATMLCQRAIEADPDKSEYRVLRIWLRTLEPAPDLKVCLVELDEAVMADEADAVARLYRGLLRERLSDEQGALRDLARVLELSPGDPVAVAAHHKLAKRAEGRRKKGILARLFGR